VKVVGHPSTLRRVGLPKQGDRVDPETVGQAFEGAQGEVALSAFDPAHVGAVHSEHVGKVLLTQTALSPEETDVATDDSLQCTFHTS